MRLRLVGKIIVLALFFAIGFLTTKNYILPKISGEKVSITNIIIPRKDVIGFLPYWLINKTQGDYSKYITTLTYFSLTIDGDGTIQKYTKPGESEPGYHSLISGKADAFLSNAKMKNQTLSLSVFGGDDDKINAMLKDPDKSAKNLLNDVTPVMEKYGFTDLNLDVEQVSDASASARLEFINFVRAIRQDMNTDKIKSLSIDVSASAFIKDTNLVDPKNLSSLVDKMIIMAYDYHYSGSLVTGAVAPLSGAGSVSEFDTVSAVEAALENVPSSKLILGIPLYGYEWETIDNFPKAATIPGSGLIVSNQRAESIISGCASCSAQFDDTDKEIHTIFKDQSTGTYYQLFYPNKESTESKIKLAKKYSLDGIALWALGYEGKTILEPLSSYNN